MMYEHYTVHSNATYESLCSKALWHTMTYWMSCDMHWKRNTTISVKCKKLSFSKSLWEIVCSLLSFIRSEYDPYFRLQMIFIVWYSGFHNVHSIYLAACPSTCTWYKKQPWDSYLKDTRRHSPVIYNRTFVSQIYNMWISITLTQSLTLGYWLTYIQLQHVNYASIGSS